MTKTDAKKKILVIEDDPRILKALSIRLKHAGYDVVTASDGLQGLKSAVEVKPDLIISDIWVPSSVGFLVAERMKAFGLGAIPVIFITGSKKKNLSRLAQEIGAVAFFEKPFDSEELLGAVARALNGKSIVPEVRSPGARDTSVREKFDALARSRASPAEAGTPNSRTSKGKT